jgi:hypothetical protein
MTRRNLQAWLNEIEPWIQGPPRRKRLWKQKLNGVLGLIAVGSNQRTQSASAAYLIHCPEFDRLVYARVCNGGMLVLQASTKSLATPEDSQSVRCLITTIADEAPRFFETFSDLRSVYAHLATEPEYPGSRIYPYASSLRQMFAAAVAFLLEEPWQAHIERSLELHDRRLNSDWILEVKKRLEQAS